MGIEYYPVCRDCNEFIDIHKCHVASTLMCESRPFYKDEDIQKLTHHEYWLGRFVWFLTHHIGHKVELLNDCNDETWDMKLDYNEVFPHRGDVQKWEAGDK